MLLTDSGPITILLIEDSASDVLLIRSYLAEGNGSVPPENQADILHASRLAEGIQIQKSRTIDVVLLDLSLPDSVGLDTFHTLNLSMPDTPIIVLTDMVDEDVALLAGQAGAQDFLNKKDLDGRLLIRSIRYAIARKKSEMELRRSEERLHSLFQNVPIGLYRSTPEGEFLDVNKALRQVLELPDDDTLVPHIPNAWAQSSQRKNWQELLNREGEVKNYIDLIQLDSGREIWLENNSRVVQDDAGNTLYYEGSIQDVTALKTAEQETQILANIYRSLSERMPGETIENTLMLLSSVIPVIYADLVFWQKGATTLRNLAEWIAPENRVNVRKFRQQVGAGQTQPDIPLGLNSVHERAAKRGAPVYVPDTEKSDIWGSSFVFQFGGASTYSLPLALQNGSRAILTLVSAQKDGFSQRHQDLLDRLRPTLAATVEMWQYQRRLEELNDSLEQRVRQRAAELSALYGLSQQLGHAADAQELGHVLLQHLQHGITYDVAAVVLDLHGQRVSKASLRRPLTDCVRTQVHDALIHAIRNSPLRTSDSQDQSWETSLHRTPLSTSDLEKPDEDPVSSLQSVVICPLTIGAVGPIVGFLYLAAEKADVYQDEQVQLFQTIANHAATSIERLETAFQTEQQRMSELVSHLPDGVVVVTGSGRIVMANPVGQAHLMQLSASYQVGDRLTTLGNLSLASLLEEPPDAGWHEVSAVGSAHRIFEIAVRPLQRSTDEPGWILVLRDITDMREHQQRLHKQERLATVGQLAAGIAHDFNNILAVITLYSQMLKQDLTRERRNQYLATLEEQAKHAARLIDQILDFSRRSVMERSPVNLYPFLQETVRMLERTLPESIAVKFLCDQKAYTVNCDPTRLQQVLMNLAVNARDAMPHGGEFIIQTRRICIEDGDSNRPKHLSPGEWICIAVRDTGVGIPAASQTHIFEPFFTTKSPGEGTGLGLAQVYGIVKQHGGEIEVHSGAETGTTFSIYLPLEARSAPFEQHEPADTQPAQQERILLVEDNKAAQEAMRDILEILGYETIVASDGRDALEIYESLTQDVDMVLSDMVMPDLGGVELFHQLQGRKPDIRMMVMTGYPLADNGRALLEQGIVDWIQKPFSIDTVAEKIRNALERQPVPVIVSTRNRK